MALEEEMKNHTESRENQSAANTLQLKVTGQSRNGEESEVKDQSPIIGPNQGIGHNEVRGHSEVTGHSDVKGLLTADLGEEIPHDEHSYESVSWFWYIIYCTLS